MGDSHATEPSSNIQNIYSPALSFGIFLIFISINRQHLKVIYSTVSLYVTSETGRINKCHPTPNNHRSVYDLKDALVFFFFKVYLYK